MRGDLGNKERKLLLTLQCLINCGYCKYNRVENSKRKPKPDKYKNTNRESIKKKGEVNVENEQ